MGDLRVASKACAGPTLPEVCPGGTVYKTASRGSFRRTRKSRGQAIILITMSTVVVFGMLALVADAGYAHFRKSACKTAAQAAARAAALEAKAAGLGHATVQPDTACPPEPAVIAGNTISHGCVYAKQNGFVNDGRQKVSMAAGLGNSPVTGIHPQYWVTSTVSESIPTLFAAVLREMGMTTRARATAAVFLPPTGGCIYAMNPIANGAVTVNGTTSLSSGCGVYVNSNSGEALTMVGISSITTTGGALTNVVGGVTVNANATISPAPVTGAPTFEDPLTALVEPTPGPCQPAVHMVGHQTKTIIPGTYCDLISLQGGQSLILEAGTYVLQAGLSAMGGTSITANGGVTLYISGGAISIAGGATVDLSGPTTGPLKGILIWQDKSNTNVASLTGGAGQDLNGALYFPKTRLNYAGGSLTNATSTTILADTINFVGNSYMKDPAELAIPFGGVSGVFLVE